MISLSSQVYAFLSCILGGLMVGLLFDIFRLSRKFFNTKDIVTHIQDVLFWVFVGFIVLITIYFSNNGVLRGYLFLGILLGVVFYFLVFSNILMKILTMLVNLLIKITETIIRVFVVPLKILLRTIRGPANYTARSLKKLYKLSIKFMKGLKLRFKRTQKIIKEKL